MRNGTYESRDFRGHHPELVSRSRGSVDIRFTVSRGISSPRCGGFPGRGRRHKLEQLVPPVFNTSTTFWTKHEIVLFLDESCACHDLMEMVVSRPCTPSRSDTGSPVMEVEHHQSGWQPSGLSLAPSGTSEIIQRAFLCSLLQPKCRKSIVTTKRRRPSADEVDLPAL